jgi:undecaprenyl-diphosphatase
VTDFIQVVLLGIIEGVTEFLPISSTGHLLIAEKLGLGARSELFNVVIQAGAILAVTFIYWRRLWSLARDLKVPAVRDYALKLGASFGITAVLGLVVKKLGFELPETVTPVAWALIVGAGLMVLAEREAEKRARSTAITWPVAVVVGVAQVLAGVFPGTSRSAATIFGAMLAGTGSRAAAAEYSFLVGIPTMYAASAYAVAKQLKAGGVQEDWGALGVAFVVSTITAFVAVKWLLHYIQRHRFTVFSVYRVVLGVLLLLILPSGS